MHNITDILDEYGVAHVGEGHQHGRPGWVQVDCPWCGQHAGKYHLGISLATGASVCWRCGKHNTAAALALATGRPRRELRERLDGAQHEAPPAAPQGKLVVPGGLEPLPPAHRAYLAARGLCAATVARLWGVQGLRMPGGKWRHLRWRLDIPSDQHGQVVSWTTRSIKKDAKQRYMSASAEQEAVPHKRILYGADYARHAMATHEGQVDVWATGPGAVATSGTAYTEAQLAAMARYPTRVVCFDSSYAAQERARALADDLAAYPGTTHRAELESGEDAADADPAELEELRAHLL